MPVTDWVSPVLSFGGAALGAGLVFWTSRTQERGRRFQAALDLVLSDDPRRQVAGRARIVEVARSAGESDRREALAVLRADVRFSCPDTVWDALSAVPPDAVTGVSVAAAGPARLAGGGILVPRELVESAKAYVEIAGGADAAPDQVVVVVSQAAGAGAVAPQAAVRPPQPAESAVTAPPAARGLPDDRRLILVKLSADAADLDDDDLRERARKAWRLSLDRLGAEPPEGVAAVVRGEVAGAWRFEGAVRSVEEPDRVEFVLGGPLPEFVGHEYRDPGQNPIRYWP